MEICIQDIFLGFGAGHPSRSTGRSKTQRETRPFVRRQVNGNGAVVQVHNLAGKSEADAAAAFASGEEGTKILSRMLGSITSSRSVGRDK